MMTRSRGFTLLEAVVALAILASGGMALFAGMNGALRAIERADRAAWLDSVARNALARLELVNPMLQPEGEAAIGEELRMRWRASELAPPQDALADYLRPGFYEVGLYRVDVEISDSTRVLHAFELRKAGWRQVRFPEAM